MSICFCIYGAHDPRCCLNRAVNRAIGDCRATANVLPSNQPWECPRCGSVNAWWVARCRCKPESAPVSPPLVSLPDPSSPTTEETT